MTPRLRRQERSLVVLSLTVMAVAITIVGVSSLHRAQVAFVDHHARSFDVGDCVVVPASPPDQVQARKASCAEDPSYIVGANTSASGSCPSQEYQHFSTDVADENTAGLCLVPNLMTNRCYLLQLPLGALQRAECDAAEANPTNGLLVQVTQRLDVHDRGACPDDGNQYVWPYPSPRRTYCTTTLLS